MSLIGKTIYSQKMASTQGSVMQLMLSSESVKFRAVPYDHSGISRCYSNFHNDQVHSVQNTAHGTYRLTDICLAIGAEPTSTLREMWEQDCSKLPSTLHHGQLLQ